MQIKDVAQKLNISPRTIRFYEEKGLLQPDKQTHNQYRTFRESDIWRLQTIVALREAGMGIADIRQALQQLEVDGKEGLAQYLELQRAVLFAKWVELKQVIATTDHMIDLLKTQQTLPLEAIYTLADGARSLRAQRSGWRDQWNFDAQAPVHDQLVQQYADHADHTERTGHSADHTALYPSYDAALTAVADWVQPLQGERGLDVGTGTGNLAGLLMGRGATMAGVDQSKEMLKQCRVKYPQLETRLGNFLALPYLERQFDFLVSSFAFHHLNEEQQALALQEMQRVLQPHGRICLAVVLPTAASAARLLALFERSGYLTRHRQLEDRLHLFYAHAIVRSPSS